MQVDFRLLYDVNVSSIKRVASYQHWYDLAYTIPSVGNVFYFTRYWMSKTQFVMSISYWIHYYGGCDSGLL